jgi:hypothetical protein
MTGCGSGCTKDAGLAVGSACLRVPDTLQVSMGEDIRRWSLCLLQRDKKQPGDRLPRLPKEHTWQYVPINMNDSLLLLQVLQVQVLLVQLQPVGYGIIQGNT